MVALIRNYKRTRRGRVVFSFPSRASSPLLSSPLNPFTRFCETEEEEREQKKKEEGRILDDRVFTFKMPATGQWKKWRTSFSAGRFLPICLPFPCYTSLASSSPRREQRRRVLSAGDAFNVVKQINDESRRGRVFEIYGTERLPRPERGVFVSK